MYIDFEIGKGFYKMFIGSTKQCDITPKEVYYDYQSVMNAFVKEGYEIVGEGGFGVILASHNCVIKLIKDFSRCGELARERDIYEAITRRTEKVSSFGARVPRFFLFEELNMERIYSPFSGFGDDGDFGHGYVVGDNDDSGQLLFKEEDKKPFLIPTEDVYLIGRPGNLIHFYVNYKLDPNLRDKLDQNQGVLFGPGSLERVFGVTLVETFTFQMGQLLSFLIFNVGLIPTDIEVVIGSRGVNNRRLCPYIYDFNESSRYTKYDNENTPILIARAMKYKNGKNYFPNDGTKYYEYFARGFLDGAGNNEQEAKVVLDEYNKLF